MYPNYSYTEEENVFVAREMFCYAILLLWQKGMKCVADTRHTVTLQKKKNLSGLIKKNPSS